MQPHTPHMKPFKFKSNLKKMKTIIVLLSLFSITAAPAFSQDCKYALPFNEGAEFEMQTFNEKNKLQSTTKSTITGKKEADITTEATVTAASFDEKNKPVTTSAYTVKCANGVFMVDMKSMLNPEQMKGFEGMEIKVSADYLEIPSELTAEQKLKDGAVVVTIEGPFPMKNTINILNRRVVGTETITTPAGTFECIKIAYDVESKFGFKVTSKAEDWYSKEAGLVQSKSYNSKGALQSYTQLTRIKK